MGTLHEGQYKSCVISRSVLRRMRNVSEKCCRENQDTYFVFNNFSFSKIVPLMTQCGNAWSRARYKSYCGVWALHVGYL